MSTRSSIAYGPHFHLYHEVLDENYVYLELEGVQFEAGYNRVIVPIPMHIWEFIRRHPGIEFDWADKTDTEIKAHVEQQVDERIARFNETQDGRGGLVRILGAMVYGMADDPREDQVAKGTEHYAKVREHQRQVKQAIDALEIASTKT